MHRARLLLLALGFASAVLVPVLAQPALACFGGHGQAYLSDFAGGAGSGLSDVPTSFYAGSEGLTATATVSVTLSCNDALEPELGRVRAHYVTEHPSPATASSLDYQDASGTSPVICASVHQGDTTQCGVDPDSHPVPITLIDDEEVGEAVEWLRFRITQGEAVTTGGGNGVGGVGSPSEARVYVVDADGASRPALEPGAEAQTYQKVEGGHIRIPVFRAGPKTDVTFSVTGHGVDPAEPGDFTCTLQCSGTLTDTNFPEAGGRLGFVRIDMVNDPTAELDESLRLSVSGAGVNDDAFTTVKILDDESDDTPPFSRFHHPRDGLKYLRGDFRIREMHTFTEDPGVAELDVVQIALRQKMKNGTCRWRQGGEFTAGPCGARHWLKMKFLEAFGPQDLYEIHMPPLTPSVGTNVANYTAWTRGIDTAGNVESTFVKGRNHSVFEILKEPQ